MRLAVLFAFFGMTTAAFAGDDAALQTEIFGHALDKDNGYACYSRSYDAAHLKAHPRQNVTTAMLLLKGLPKPDTMYYATVDFTFRKHKRHFQATGDCPSVSTDGSTGPVQSLSCGIDCDGGTIAVKLKDDGSVLVSLPPSGGVAVTSPDVDNGAPTDGHFGSDDTVFMLTRAPAKTCLSLGTEDEDKAALKKLP